MMDDLINRQAAIDALRYAQHRFTVADEAGGMGIVKWSEDVIYFAAAEKVLDEMPTIEAEPRWIPVTERLPEESDGTVLVCMPNIWPYNYKEPFINAKHNCQVRTATHSEHSGNWYYSDGAVGDVEPIAWMPLPEPYQEAKDGLD